MAQHFHPRSNAFKVAGHGYSNNVGYKKASWIALIFLRRLSLGDPFAQEIGHTRFKSIGGAGGHRLKQKRFQKKQVAQYQ